MKANFLDLRYKMKHILKSLERNEPVRIFFRGIEKAHLVPIQKKVRKKVIEDEAFGLWKDRKDMKNVRNVMKKLRGGRYLDL